MQHLFNPRPLIDSFEQTLINAFSPLKSVQAIWIRESRSVGQPKFARIVWLQLSHRSLGDFRQIEALTAELQVRVTDTPFTLEIRWVVDDLPPAAICPSCIFRRGSGKV